ncbi:PREDICTED: lactosylceramide 4-alpha-galactosyltransferase-like [Nelumbo nucifera]|uniref:Lactosylceramide 4-alpha-galactosyltransferase-like n=2 Tax=Nelumbo nucifera TaxID=4432 RepID=A0A1U8A495_NELNU|nr:PREDICTED: lactosylceramide 4-alpha-galactosyltransferase-like [Nelumbo nucifera]DAD26678.1 TPA_asm: hypothetical protein HUJ06_028146 [Nelumbo nucifera]
MNAPPKLCFLLISFWSFEFSRNSVQNLTRNRFNSWRLGNMKFSIFSTISFAALLFVALFAGSTLCNLFLHDAASRHKRDTTLVFPSHKAHRQFKSISSPLSLLSVKREVEEACIKDPPPSINVTEQQGIARFHRKPLEFEILRPTALARQFARRAGKFFQSRCEMKFFMTWISPARTFRRREFFALESLFKAHPHGCLMILSATMDSRHGGHILKPLHDRGFKVLAVTPDLPYLFENTAAITWFDEIKKGNKDPGEIPLAQNLSNLLRLAVLYKYGGVYMDTDFIILKKFSGLRNSIGAQSMDAETGSWTRLNNAVLVFDKNHPLLLNFMEEFSITFNGNKWGYNGPYLVSRVTQRVEKMPGYNFTVLPPMAFYPVAWNKIDGFFQRPQNPAMSRWISAKLHQLSGETYGVHLWNRMSRRLRIEEGSIIGRLISDHCIICEDIYSA